VSSDERVTVRTEDSGEHRFGTGLVSSRIGAGRLSRAAGPDRPEGLRSADAPALAGLSAGRARVVLPELRDRWHVWPVPGPRSVAATLLAGDGGDATVMADVGAVLRAVHGLGVPPGLAAPAGTIRWLRWLATGQGPRAASRLAGAARERWGAGRLRRLADWGAGADGRVLLHGAPGLGSVYAGPAGVTLVTGDELAAGPPAADLGWLLGELVELAAAGDGRLAPRCAGLAGALLAGYGPGPDPAELDRAAIFRLLGHAHDFAAYVGWHPTLLGQLDLVAELADGHPDLAALGRFGLPEPPRSA
jgi:hypothetical protein